MPTKPPITVTLSWDDESRFTARSGGAQLVLDGKSQAGPSPMQALAAALAGCMAIDVVDILRKGRHPVRGLSATLHAARADGVPARMTSVTLEYRIEGEVPVEAVDRAIRLSREKYCSVWHSLRDDIELAMSFQVVQGR